MSTHCLNFVETAVVTTVAVTTVAGIAMTIDATTVAVIAMTIDATTVVGIVTVTDATTVAGIAMTIAVAADVMQRRTAAATAVVTPIKLAMKTEKCKRKEVSDACLPTEGLWCCL